MATAKGGSKKDKKGKKPHRNKLTSKKYSHYKIEGENIIRLRKNCPRCGPGTFLSEHKGRKYCGKCHYAEFEGKKALASDGGKDGSEAAKAVKSEEGKVEKKEEKVEEKKEEKVEKKEEGK